MRNFDTEQAVRVGPVSTSAKMAARVGAEKKKEVMDWRRHPGTKKGAGETAGDLITTHFFKGSIPHLPWLQSTWALQGLAKALH